MAFDLARLRLSLLCKLGWRGLFSFNQQRALLKDVFRGLFLVPFYGTKLREAGWYACSSRLAGWGSQTRTQVLLPGMFE
jgi:hypothetical protein